MPQIPTRQLPVFYIHTETASTRIQNFLNNKHGLLSTEINKDDTKSIWYSFQHIEELYKELVFLNADGLRLYFGAYESNHPDFSNQLCILMVPTYLNTSLKHEDILLEEQSNYEDRGGNVDNLKGIHDLLDTKKPLNYGSPCPPVCPIHEFRYP